MSYQICTSCIMDTSDPKIVFDEHGACDHCTGFRTDLLPKWHPNEHGKALFLRHVEEINKAARGAQYDSIMGLSGGLDSSYQMHVAVTEFGLKPLVVHVDGEWNTDIAVNSQVLVEKLGLDLYAEVIDWPEMQDFRLAYFKSGTPHPEIPQDHAFFATMFHFAGEMQGYDIGLATAPTSRIRIPMTFMGGAGNVQHMRDLIAEVGVVGAGAGTMFVFKGPFRAVLISYARP